MVNHNPVNYVSPCGIYCIACPKYQKDNSCRGCRLDAKHNSCDIYDCCVTLGAKNFCHECDSFPCERLKEFTNYHPGESFAHYRHVAIENLKRMRDIGIDAWVKEMNQKMLTGKYTINSINEQGNSDRSPCFCVRKQKKK